MSTATYRFASLPSSAGRLLYSLKSTKYPRGSQPVICWRAASNSRHGPNVLIQTASVSTNAAKLPKAITNSVNTLPDAALRGSYVSAKTQREQLARKLVDSGRTQLYTAPSHAWFLWGAYFAGGFCFFGAFMIFQVGFWQPQPDLPAFVPWAHRTGLVTLGAIGAWPILRSAGHITALNLVRLANGSIKMRVTVRRMLPLPFIPPRQFVIDPSDFLLPSRMVAQLSIPAMADTRQLLGMGNILTRLRRRISLVLWSFFAGTRKMFTQEGVMDIAIKGQGANFRLDIDGHFAADGRYLHDLVGFEA